MEQSASFDQQPEIKTSNKKKKLLILGLVCLFALAIGGSYYVYTSQNKAEPKNMSSTKKTELKKLIVSEEDPILKKFITPTTGEVWLSTPKELASQNYFQDTEYGDQVYYEVGKRAGNTIIMAISSYGIGSYTSLYEKTPEGKVTAILEPDGESVYNQESIDDFARGLRPEIERNMTIHYDSLTLPKSIKFGKGQILQKPTSPTVGDLVSPEHETGTITDVKELGKSSLKKAERTYADTKLTSISYFIQTPINTKIKLTYEPLETNLDRYQWSKGYASGNLRPIARGCGGIGSSVTRSDVVSSSDIQLVGKSPSNQEVYELKDQNHPLIKKAFEEFKEYAGSDSQVPYWDITKEEFINQHAVVIYKDKFGQYLVYAREDLSPAYGCAKPVVYLYPTETQMVNIRVGADVKISDPQYNPKTGWNALAQTNGRLIVDGKEFSSLFWEGPGIGEYPAITSGTVVKREHAIATIKKQLAQQGFTQSEINDFVEYWHDKLPTKPYVRLSWLTTKQMNIIAPLSITPKPNTVLRTFLDFSGLDQPIYLPKQTFNKVDRKGFTVVEWGGLSLKKLY